MGRASAQLRIAADYYPGYAQSVIAWDIEENLELDSATTTLLTRSTLREARATSPWYALPVVVIDFETTGPDPNECRPVEVGLVRFERGAPVQRWSSLVNRRAHPARCDSSARHHGPRRRERAELSRSVGGCDVERRARACSPVLRTTRRSIAPFCID